jgi:hypothetical protein
MNLPKREYDIWKVGGGEKHVHIEQAPWQIRKVIVVGIYDT